MKEGLCIQLEKNFNRDNGVEVTDFWVALFYLLYHHIHLNFCMTSAADRKTLYLDFRQTGRLYILQNEAGKYA